MYQVEKRYNKTQTNQYNGKVYHSCKEAGHARLLDRRVANKEILGWESQYKIDFFIEMRDGVPVLVANPLARRNSQYLCRYYLDFKVDNPDGTIEFVEVKGLEGMDWRMKWTMLESVYGNDPMYKLMIIK